MIGRSHARFAALIASLALSLTFLVGVGYVYVSCDFGYAIDDPTGNPTAGHEAKVSG